MKKLIRLMALSLLVVAQASVATAVTEIPEDPAPDACALAEREGKECKRWYQRGEVIVLQGVRFDTGSARIKPVSASILDRNIAKLKRAKRSVRVEGHTDAVGGDAYNQRLSEARANAVMEYFRDKGVNTQSMSAVGYGEARPVASNDTAQGRAQNRRIELHLK